MPNDNAGTVVHASAILDFCQQADFPQLRLYPEVAVVRSGPNHPTEDSLTRQY